MQRTSGKNEVKDAAVERAAPEAPPYNTATALREAAEAIRQLTIAINNQTLVLLDDSEDDNNSTYDLSGKRIA